MSDIANHLHEVLARMAEACVRSGRQPGEVDLIAVSKTFPAEAVREAVQSGQQQFGESRVQEAEEKIAALPPGLRWHFIGRLQRNKVRKVLKQFQVIHAVDSVRLAQALDATAAELGVSPEVYLQVNVGGELSKGGFDPSALEVSMPQLLELKHLRLRGLMTIPPPEDEAENARKWFVMLRQLRDGVALQFGVALPGLSMGMSHDFEIAIEEGATCVRVGSQIFGKRAARVDGELGAG